jgi:uncharacterized protein YbaA (DUF1428 family)
MLYIDLFISAVPTTNRERYLAHTHATSRLLKEHGALSVQECWGDDVPEGKLTSLPMAVKCEDNETVAFGIVNWASKAARDEGMKKFMADPRLEPIEMPFDGKRVIFGGFSVIVQA